MDFDGWEFGFCSAFYARRSRSGDDEGQAKRSARLGRRARLHCMPCCTAGRVESLPTYIELI